MAAAEKQSMDLEAELSALREKVYMCLYLYALYVSVVCFLFGCVRLFVVCACV